MERAAAGSGEDQGLPGHLDQNLPLHQREQAPGGGGSEDIGEREVLQHQGIASTESRTAEVDAFYWTVLAPDIVNPGREEQGSFSV